MEIKLNRIEFNDKSTIGELFIDDKLVSNTLEDVVRQLPETCPNTPKGINCKCAEKVYGKTAIPAGTYKVILSYSNRFKRILPEVCNVPHFLGIRIHSLNNSSQTEGCIGVGEWNGKDKDWISNSKATYDRVFKLISEAIDRNETIELKIVNDYKRNKK